MTNNHSVAALLCGEIDTGSTVVVKGWLRSKRDSKAGISFLAIHDGSSFDAIQAVVPSTLSNYTAEVPHLSPG
jgi:asparaginyl-tRNA synthetase